MLSRALVVLSLQGVGPVRASVNRMGKSENDPLESQTDLDSIGCRLRRLWRDTAAAAAHEWCWRAIPLRGCTGEAPEIACIERDVRASKRAIAS